MACVLDACAIVAFLRGEPGGDVIQEILKNEECYAHSLNLCEVYYRVKREQGEAIANQFLDDVLKVIIERPDMDRPFWTETGEHKIQFGIAIADCIAVSLSRRISARLISSDHRELEPVAQSKICQIDFFR